MAALTVGTIVAGLSASIKGIVEGAISIIKILALVGFGLIFAGAIVSLLGLITNAISTSVMGEFFALVSLCLPFNPHAVFSSLVLIIDGIIVFLVARKIYEMTADIIGKA